ncbi:2-oxo acid dehydrogenase subunit E2, partial [Kitasatospora sp. NPDC059571]|uniref:2-oxo acid dehydrogenase subunit E2 n=1 Tax=Kitasatospora sp. NPDC059571 TaxID=3346871 RepID=UPI0036A4678D
RHCGSGRSRALRAAARPADGRVRATPLARRTAAEAGIDLAGVRGTGHDGTVRVADVRAAVEAAPPARSEPPDTGRAGTPDRSAAMRRAVGDLMARAKREIPHYYLSTTVDLSAALDWLRERNRRLPVTERLVPAALLLKAAALAAREVPQLNGHWTGDGFAPAAAVHLGVAVALRGGGLVAPAIHDAADLPVADLMAALRDVVARARGGRLRGSETTDPTITVTNLGYQGVEAVFGVIYPPQVPVGPRPAAAETGGAVNHDQALALVREVLTEIVPDADFAVLGPDENYRDALELDSLDFLTLVERLSVRADCRIDEDDYPRLGTLTGTADLLAERT